MENSNNNLGNNSSHENSIHSDVTTTFHDQNKCKIDLIIEGRSIKQPKWWNENTLYDMQHHQQRQQQQQQKDNHNNNNNNNNNDECDSSNFYNLIQGQPNVSLIDTTSKNRLSNYNSIESQNLNSNFFSTCDHRTI